MASRICEGVAHIFLGTYTVISTYFTADFIVFYDRAHSWEAAVPNRRRYVGAIDRAIEEDHRTVSKEAVLITARKTVTTRPCRKSAMISRNSSKRTEPSSDLVQLLVTVVEMVCVAKLLTEYQLGGGMTHFALVQMSLIGAARTLMLKQGCYYSNLCLILTGRSRTLLTAVGVWLIGGHAMRGRLHLPFLACHESRPATDRLQLICGSMGQTPRASSGSSRKGTGYPGRYFATLWIVINHVASRWRYLRFHHSNQRITL